ncbi:MAG: glutamine synthetase, partial [Pyrobaculum sp.]
IILTALEGLEKKTEPPPPTTEIAYELEGVSETPRNLGEAIKQAPEGVVARYMPPEFVKAYLALKAREWEEYLSSAGSWEATWNHVTQWEYDRYLKG